MSNRPEYLGPPELFYNDAEALKYTNNSRIIDIQVEMSKRAIELLSLRDDETNLLLDIGCGSGLSGGELENKGHFWVGIDISAAMLRIGLQRDVKGDMILTDMGQGLPFKSASFDGIISISALQWLCNINNSKQVLHKRLDIFFSTLFACLSTSGRAVFQFYPENNEQVNIITTAAARAGFFGGTVVDYPNSKSAKKVYLVLMTSSSVSLSEYTQKRRSIRHKLTSKRRYGKKETDKKFKKNWILEQKKKYRKKGKCVQTDSKYSGRKRKNKF